MQSGHCISLRGAEAWMQDVELDFRPYYWQREWDLRGMLLVLIYLLSCSFEQKKS